MKAKRFWIMMLCAVAMACKQPTENIKVVVDTDIIKYTAMITVTDAQTGNVAPANATIAVLGENAQHIYELSGKKELKLVQGMVTIGLHPNIAPSGQSPIRVMVEIAAPGYATQRKEIIFTIDKKQQLVPIGISKVGNTQPPIVVPPPPVYEEVSLNFTGRCPNRADVEIRPSVYVSFRKSGSTGPFQYLGYMDKGQISTNRLALNESYDFQIVYGGESYQVSQLIAQRSYQLTIDMTAACNF